MFAVGFGISRGSFQGSWPQSTGCTGAYRAPDLPLGRVPESDRRLGEASRHGAHRRLRGRSTWAEEWHADPLGSLHGTRIKWGRLYEAGQTWGSTRTVEWHLGKVYTKLGVGSRRDLRRALASLGQADPRA